MPTTVINNWGDAVLLAVSTALTNLVAAIPAVIGALLILVLGWLLAGVVGRLVQAVVQRAGADRVFARHGRSVYGARADVLRPSLVAGELAKWLIRIISLVAAANVLNLPEVSQLLDEFLLWVPNLVVAAIVLLLAPVLGRFVRGAIEVGAGEMGFTNAALLGRVAEVAILAFAVVIAINQVGIAANLVNALFIGLVAAVALAFGLAFGLGGRDVAAQITRDWYVASQQKAAELQRRSDVPDRPRRAPLAASRGRARPR